jgi:hypothetical protein
MTPGCPTAEELSRALAHGSTTGLVEHIASCSRCSDEWDGALRLRALVRALPAPPPARGRALHVRARLVAEAPAARRRARVTSGVVAAFAALAAAALVVFAFGLRRAAPRVAPDAVGARYHGAVIAAVGARYARLSAAPDEVVLLESGTIHVEVSPLGTGERFRVRAADGEVEVRGTAFDVAVEGGHLNAVTVQHGRVEVRGAGAGGATLTAGERWHSAPAAAPTETAQNTGPMTGVHPRAHVGSMSSTARVPIAAPADTSPMASRASTGTPLEVVPSTSRETASSPATIPPVSPALNAPAKHEPPPASTAAPEMAPNAHTPARDARERDDERRDRRDERRERFDQRRVR